MGLFKKLGKKVKAPRATLAINLDKSVFSQGENATGKLVVTSAEDCEVTQIRIELSVVETIRTGKKTEKKRFGVSTGEKEEGTISHSFLSERHPVCGGITLNKGFMKEYPFSIPIKTGIPVTYRGLNASNEWSVKAVMDVPGRPDVRNQVNITVGPPRVDR